MNILYIGPYLSNSTVAFNSTDIIQTLISNTKIEDLTIRPCFMHEADRPIDHNNPIIENLSKKRLKDGYDVIIQHCPINLLTSAAHICNTNIAVPLFNKRINSHEMIERCQDFNFILSDNADDSKFLETYTMQKNVDTFEYSNIYTEIIKAPSIGNASIFSDNTKYYIILDQYDERLLALVVKAFCYGVSQNDDLSLAIYINTKDDQISNKASHLINSIHKEINYRSNNHNIYIFAKNFNLQELCSIHKSCNIFMYLNACNYNSIQLYIAKQLKKPIITLDMVMSDLVPYIDPHNPSVGELIPLAGHSQIVNHMQQALVNPDKYIDTNSYKTIDNIICP